MTGLLARHIGHHTEPLDDRRLRCHTCSHTLVIQPSSTTSTSTSPIPGPGDPRCPRHPHEHAGTCRPCAADAKADEHREVIHQPTADVATRAAEARAALPPRAVEPRPRTPTVDPERMAQARAELDQHRNASHDQAGAT